MSSQMCNIRDVFMDKIKAIPCKFDVAAEQQVYTIAEETRAVTGRVADSIVGTIKDALSTQMTPQMRWPG